jgi:hypothetical protein
LNGYIMFGRGIWDNYTLYQNAVFWLIDERGICLPILSFFSFSAIAGVFA